jgi:hypothetical protein
MNIIRNLCKAALLALWLAIPAAQAQTIEAISSPLYNAPFRDSSGSLLSGAYVTVGSFGDRTAEQVVNLFSAATTASQRGAVLTSYYTSLLTPVAVNASNFSIINDDGFAPDNLSTFNNTPIYSVVAKQLGADLFEIGIFGAYNFTRSGSPGYYSYTRGSQINFTSLNDELGLEAIRFRQAVPSAGGGGADALFGFGTASPSGFSLGNVTSTVVPEPSSASLMLLGAAGVLALRRLRKNNV